MNIINTNFTIAELCDQFARKDLDINRNYQRSDAVWPDNARSFLIETIILGYPVPKITIRQRTDVKQLRTFKEIVDGQQRTKAIYDFYKGDLTLSRTLETPELQGRKFESLDEQQQQLFVSYSLGADLLVGANEEEVREVFRRMNSYTVPLNPEEQRHATYQGPFKWFIYDLARTAENIFSHVGTFKEKDFVRMQDAKLLTEICYSLLYGIETIQKKHLDKVYKANDKSFGNGEHLKTPIIKALELINEIPEITQSPLAKSYNFYSLVLAFIQACHPFATLEKSLNVAARELASTQIIAQNLSQLSEVLQLNADDPNLKDHPLRPFFEACASRTNVKEQREIRFKYFYCAITNQIQ